MRLGKFTCVAIALLAIVHPSQGLAGVTEIVLSQYQFDGSPGDPPLSTSTFASPQWDFLAGEHYRGDFFLYAEPYPSGGFFATVDFAAPDGVPLQVGTYTGATRWPFNAPGTPGFDFTIGSAGSNTLEGQFTVLEAVYDANGVMQHFGATFEAISPVTGRAWETGTVYYNFDLPVSSVPEPAAASLGVLSLAALLCSFCIRYKKSHSDSSN